MDSVIWTEECNILLYDLINNNIPFETFSLYLNKDELFLKNKIKELIPTIRKKCNKKSKEIYKYIGESPYKFDHIRKYINGKKVLIIDFETTGFPANKNIMYKYTDNVNFDTCRIIEIGYFYTDNFDYNMDNIILHNFLRKPIDFTSIDPAAEAVHKISFENIMTNGIDFKDILLGGLLYALNEADVFISHNTNFDFNVLLNELHRLKYPIYNKTINKLLKLKYTKNVICTCKASGYTKLSTIYADLFNELPLGMHRACDDVKTLLEILLGRQIKNIK